MKNSDTMAAVTAGAAVATSSLSLGDWASIASMAAAVVSIGLSFFSVLTRNKREKENE
jgi:hypothetical protein